MKKRLFLLVMGLLLSTLVFAEEPKSKLNIMKLLGNLDAINLVLAGVALFLGTLFYKGREKLRQTGELFLKAYEYTDDHVLTPIERFELKNRFLELMGKKREEFKVPEPLPEIVAEEKIAEEPIPEVKSETRRIKARRRKDSLAQ